MCISFNFLNLRILMQTVCDWQLKKFNYFHCVILGRNSAEVKRATIVGNPMFSANEDVQKNGVTPPDLASLDDLQLDMDYEQIMHYFENLKVRRQSF